MTPLTLAARDGRVDVVKFLIEHGAASNERALNDAIMVGSMSATGTREIVDLLKNARLKTVAPAPRGMNDADARMIQAAASGDIAALEAAFNDGATVDARDDRGMDALSWAALRGHDAIVLGLLDRGADVNRLNSSGWPPLGQACGQGKLDVVQTLLARGANVNMAFDGGRTALMCAAYQGFTKIVEVLLEAGADPSMRHEHATARDLAARQGHRDIVEMLDGR